MDEASTDAAVNAGPKFTGMASVHALRKCLRRHKDRLTPPEPGYDSAYSLTERYEKLKRHVPSL